MTEQEAFEKWHISEYGYVSPYMSTHKKFEESIHQDRFIGFQAGRDYEAERSFDYMRIREWAKSSPRKPANQSFTESIERNVAYLIEELQTPMSEAEFDKLLQPYKDHNGNVKPKDAYRALLARGWRSDVHI